MSGPQRAVFTTAWSKDGNIHRLKQHLEMMKNHAQRLKIDLPNDLEERIISFKIPKQETLVKIRWENELILTFKEPVRLRFAEAISVPAPRWTSSVNGCKHGDWQPYLDARNLALEKGADEVILVHEYCVVDAGRAMPVIFDEDGTLWIASPNQGGVDSTTFGMLRSEIEKMGIPICEGRLNERLTARAREFLLLGVGIGVANVTEIDGVEIGDGSNWLGDRLNETLDRLRGVHGEDSTGV